MSVIVWDSRTKVLATDRQGTCADMKFLTSKMRRSTCDGKRMVVCAFAGDLARGAAMVTWYLDGANPEKLPKFQEGDGWAQLVVATPEECFYLEDTAEKIKVEGEYMAWGSGRDFAMGALAMGADAKQAVEVACRFSVSCGMGVDVADLSGQ